MNQRFPYFFSGIAAIALCLSSVPSASAITITPTGTSFGPLSAATFGGSGIPNDAVQITTVGDVTLGLTATPRYSDPAVTNDGAGTFSAVVGNDTAQGHPAYAQWNVDLYVQGLATNQFARLFYDNDSSVGNDVSSSIFLPVDYQDSWNLGMSFLNGGVFNPNTSGQYAFALVVYQSVVLTDSANEGPVQLGSVEQGRAAILVNVGNASSVPDGGNMMLMFAGAIGALAMLRRRFVA